MQGDRAELVSHEVAHDKRCVFVRLGPQAHFRHMAADFRDLIRREPAIGAYDYVCDLTQFAGDAFLTDVEVIAKDYAPHAPGEQAYTCFATPDAAFHLWAKWMDEVFSGRKHLVFSSVRECWAFLDQKRQRAAL